MLHIYRAQNEAYKCGWRDFGWKRFDVNGLRRCGRKGGIKRNVYIDLILVYIGDGFEGLWLT